MSKSELKDYFKWFLAIIPARIETLAQFVRMTPNFESWQPDLVPSSLVPLGLWLASQAKTRRRNEEEIEDMKRRLGSPIDPPDKEELTERTFSLAMDVGMYLSQVFLKRHPTLRWEQPLTSKRFVDYGQPVLVEFSFGPLNPIRLVITLVYGFAAKSAHHGELGEIYDVWSKGIVATSLTSKKG
jgi:hypothetical protein